MRRYAQVLFESIVGRSDAYAVQQPDGSYLTIRRPLTVDLLEEHIAGRRTLGSYLVTSEGKARCGVYDFDAKTEAARQTLLWLRCWFQHWGIDLAIEFSGSKGYHGWVITKNFVPASKVIQVLKLPLRQLQEEMTISIPVEIFPKQAVAQNLGNLIKLPWGIHQRSGKRTAFLGEDFRPLPDLGLRFVEGLPAIDEGHIDEILGEYADEDEESGAEKGRLGHSQDEILEMLTRSLRVGERRPTLVTLAGYLRYRGIPEQVAVALLLPWAEKCFSEPLPAEEVERHIRGIYRRYGVTQRERRWHMEHHAVEVEL